VRLCALSEDRERERERERENFGCMILGGGFSGLSVKLSDEDIAEVECLRVVAVKAIFGYLIRVTDVSRTITFPNRRFPDKTFPGKTFPGLPGQTFPGRFV